MAYVDSLYGHQSEINAIDSFYKEGSVVTVSCDRTARNWNIIDGFFLKLISFQSTIQNYRLFGLIFLLKPDLSN